MAIVTVKKKNIHTLEKTDTNHIIYAYPNISKASQKLLVPVRPSPAPITSITIINVITINVYEKEKSIISTYIIDCFQNP